MAIAALVVLGGCEDTKKNDRLEGRIAYLEERIGLTQIKLQEAESAAATLSEEVGRFDTEDWAQVMGDVKDAKDETVSAVDEAVKAADGR